MLAFLLGNDWLLLFASIMLICMNSANTNESPFPIWIKTHQYHRTAWVFFARISTGFYFSSQKLFITVFVPIIEIVCLDMSIDVLGFSYFIVCFSCGNVSILSGFASKMLLLFKYEILFELLCCFLFAFLCTVHRIYKTWKWFKCLWLSTNILPDTSTYLTYLT